MTFKNILVVCAGNICRSPMAHVIFQHHYPIYQIDSAGIIGVINAPADPKAQVCIQKIGLDLSSHRAKVLTAEQLKNHDLILVMSFQQQRHIEQQWPFAKGKVYRLGHWREKDIPDPYQKTQQDFDDTCQLITTCIEDWKDYL